LKNREFPPLYVSREGDKGGEFVLFKGRIPIAIGRRKG
jgi:hypothetical protein